MRVRVLYFAALRELAGRSEESVELGAGATVEALARGLEQSRPGLRGRLSAIVRFARNEEFVERTAPLSEGDVVALIPPVAGGSGRMSVAEGAIDPAEVVALVRRPGAGAVVVFEGTVRDVNEGLPVVLLEYEAYATMAVAEMERIAQEIGAAHPEARLAARHRVGSLRVGDAAIVCAVSAPHRDEAFVACRRLIDLIKERVPIWKREHGPDGAHWVGWQDARCGHAHEDPARAHDHPPHGHDR